MAYSLQEYINLGDLEQLSQRLRNLEFLLKPFNAEYTRVKRIIEDPIYAQEELEKWKEKIDDLQLGIGNCQLAIELLKNDTGEDDDEFEEDD